MQNNKPNGTRITVERISVTSIRTRKQWQKIYCYACRREIVPTELVPSQQIEKEQIEAIALTPAEGVHARIGDRK